MLSMTESPFGPHATIATLFGTRPEIIRLSRLIHKLDQHVDHLLVHTGQNYDYELNEIFFEQMGLRRPDVFLGAAGAALVAPAGFDEEHAL